MHIKRTFLIITTFFCFLAFFTSCSSGKNNEEKKIDKNIEQNDIDKKDKYHIPRNEITISMMTDLDNNDEIKKIARESFYKYYGVKMQEDDFAKFDINRVVDQGKTILNVSFMGDINNESYYLSMVINKDEKIMERIDATNYNDVEQNEKIDSSQAEKIAEEYLLLVDKEKYHDIGTIKIVENTRDGYKLIFTEKDNEDNAITISVNPYTAKVTSYVIHWK